MDSTLLDIIGNLDSNYVFFDSLGNLTTTDSLILSVLDSNNIDSTIIQVDSLGNFVTNDSILQMLLTDSSFISVDSFGNYMSFDSSLISITNGTFLPPDSTGNIMQQDSAYLNDTLLVHYDSLTFDESFDSSFDSLSGNFNAGILNCNSTGDSLFIDNPSLDIFNSFNLFDIDSSGNVTNSIIPEDELAPDAANPLLNKMIFKIGTERFRGEHYGLTYAPTNSFYFGVSQLKLAPNNKIGVYYQGSISGARFSDPSSDAVNGNAPKINLSLADMNVSPLFSYQIGNAQMVTSTGFYVSILIPEFKHGTAFTENNIGNTTGYGSHVMVGAIYDRMFLEFSGRFGKIANSKINESNTGNKDDYFHKGFSASMDYYLREHVSLHLAYRYETFARGFDKTSSSLRIGMGIIF